MEHKRVVDKFNVIDTSSLITAKDWVEYLTEFAETDNEIYVQGNEYGGEVYMNIYRLETDEEATKREASAAAWEKSLKERRHETYLKLKEEFEGQ